jgi:hypothetical protein
MLLIKCLHVVAILHTVTQFVVACLLNVSYFRFKMVFLNFSLPLPAEIFFLYFYCHCEFRLSLFMVGDLL